MSTKDDAVFRAEVCRVLAGAIEKAKISKSAAAKVLQISRQALYKYLNAEATPRSVVLSRAFREWGVKFRYKDVEFGGSALAGPRASKAPAAVQIEIFAATQALEKASFEIVGVQRKKNGMVDLQLRIKLAG